MAWSGGTFTRTNGVNSGATTWATDAAAGVKIRADRHDTHDQDLATGINQCLNKDGCNTATQLNVDNLRLDGNTISSQNSNGNIELSPNGTGRTVVSNGGTSVSSYVSGTHTYINVDGAYVDAFDVVTNVTESSFETVGPTGSGATNIWAGMDAMPSGARIAIVWVATSITADGADRVAVMELKARQTGSAISTGRTVIHQQYVAIDDYTAGAPQAGTLAFIPLDSSRTFEVTWTATNDTARTAAIYLRGFIV